MTRDELQGELKGLSKARLDELIPVMAEEPDMLKMMFEFSVGEIPHASWRATWAMAHFAKAFPMLVEPYLGQIVDFMPTIKHHSQMGCFLRLFLLMKVDFTDYGILIDVCFNNLGVERYPMYIKNYSIKLLELIAKQFPEIREEMAIVIEQHMDYFESPYLRMNAQKAVRNMRKG